VTGRTNYTLLCKANFNKFIQRIRRLQRNHAVCCKMKKKYKKSLIYTLVSLEWAIIFLKILTECRVSTLFRTNLVITAWNVTVFLRWFTYTENYCLYLVEAVDPLLALWALAPRIKHPKEEALVVELDLHDACRLHSGSQNVLKEAAPCISFFFFTCFWELRCLWRWILDRQTFIRWQVTGDSLTQLTIKRPYFDTLFFL
jgi:hypothetical protein